MVSIEEFRESFINEEINASAVVDSRYPIEVFIDVASDILENDYSLISGMEQCYFEFTKGNRAYKSMRIDAAYLDFATNTINLLYADYNESEVKNITNEFIMSKTQLMLNYMENIFKGYFNNGEIADPAVQLAKDIKNNISEIGTIHLFIISTDQLSKTVKKLPTSIFKVGDKEIQVIVDVLDIEKIYKSRMAGFEKEDLVILCDEYNIEGIPCIKADIETEQYESYLAIVPGEFLAQIYKEHGPKLLESNVRSFLKFNGAVNKGIRGTVLNEKDRFFTYNNGISTTATAVSTEVTEQGLLIKSFVNLQIINGGQTTATLAATKIKNNADLSGIYIQMKLTILKDENPELIRNIARFANSQNKVKTADLNSSHPFYVRMEDFSRKIYAPLATGQIYQQLWFFERARGQYEQPLMQMTKKQVADYKLVRPRSMKYSLTDMAKYINAADMLPHYVSWGGEVNAAHFHANMEKQWEKDDNVFNELYYKELIGKKILFEHIGHIISDQLWYQEKRAYRPQLIAYTFSKLVLVAKEKGLKLNYRKMWDLQNIPECLDKDISQIAKLVFDAIYDDNRANAHIETYCKKVECWNVISKIPYELSEQSRDALVDENELKVEKARAKKEQKFNSSIQDEITIFQQGVAYWESLIARGKSQEVLSGAQERSLLNAIKYCNLEYLELSRKQVSDIVATLDALREFGIE